MCVFKWSINRGGPVLPTVIVLTGFTRKQTDELKPFTSSIIFNNSTLVRGALTASAILNVICFVFRKLRQLMIDRPYKHMVLTGVLVLFVFAGCTSPDSKSGDHQDTDKPLASNVQHFGPMRDVMRAGKTQSRIRLSDANAKPHAFAVGALEGLAGEVTIIDGDVWVSRVASDGTLSVTGPQAVDGDAATLMSISYVSKWHATRIESACTGIELELLIEEFARSMGIDTNKPFPFKIEGELNSLNLHVINGYCPIATDPATQARKPWRNPEFEIANVTIVGFYAPNAVAVMTHHGTAIHAHAFGNADGTQIMGHIDNVTVEPGMILFVPNLK